MNKPTENREETMRHKDEHHDKSGSEGSKSPERLEREVDQARARLSSTASELSDRLSPGELIDQALNMAREHGGEFGRNLGAQVKNNPMPMILTSVGLSWMMMSSGGNDASSAHTRPGSDVAEGDGGFMASLGDAAANSRDRASAAGERMQDAGANMKESAQNARDGLVQFYRDQPLIAGSLGIAIGAALGALVPPTEIEDDMMGDVSDRAVDAAKSRASDTYDEVRDSARAG